MMADKKERPILMSAPEVLALLAGTKTQKRRVVKWRQLTPGLNLGFSGLHAHQYPGGWVLESQSRTSWEERCWPTPCPYGHPGDRLWVREAWRACAEADPVPPREMDAAFRIWYEADAQHQPGFGKYRQPMFMPRRASRITLEITDVRVQRLQEISEADARAEGAAAHPDGPWHAYRSLWSLINGASSWEANPWVWALTFKQIQP